jgi:hypothetical protein
MTSKQLPSSPAIQSRYLYKYYQPIDNRLNLSYSQYATLSNRPYHNISLPYASSAYGVYRRIPAHLKTPPLLHTNLNRRIDLRNRSQQRQLSLNNDDREINGLINTTDSHQNQNEENSSDTSHHSIVSLIPIYLLLFIRKKEFFLSLFVIYVYGYLYKL